MSLGGASGWTFDTDYNPSNGWNYPVTFVANDPMVHYTVGDLIWPGYTQCPSTVEYRWRRDAASDDATAYCFRPPIPAWGIPKGAQATDMLFKDPQVGVGSASAWQFPSNKYPSIGWLGRVHRGTPWQTVYFQV